MWIQNCNTNQIVVFGENLKVREFFYTRVIVWTHTILVRIWVVFPLRMKVFAWYINLNIWIS